MYDNYNIKRKRGLVSVIIATYNYGHFICDALDGLKNQTYTRIEVIIMDDGSTDNTESIVKRWYRANGKPFENFVYCKLPRNCTQGWALNIGFQIAKGGYIVIHDADDISHRNKILTQIRVLEENPDTAAVGSNFRIFYNKSSIRGMARWLSFDKEEIQRNYKENSKNCVSFGTLMLRSSIFKEIIGLKKHEKGSNDVAFLYDLVKGHNYIVDNLSDVLIYIRLYKERDKLEYKEYRTKRKIELEKKEGLVSVVIPVKNSLRTILRTLKSIEQQTYPNVEVIIVDDASVGYTETIVKNWYSKYKKQNIGGVIQELVYFKLPRSVGYPWVYNIGSYLSKGEYIVFHGDGGVSHIEKLEKQVGFLENNSDYSVIGTNYNTSNSFIKYDDDIYKNYRITYDACVNIETIMLRSSVISETAGMNRKTAGKEDFDFVYRLINKGHKVQNLREVLYFER